MDRLSYILMLMTGSGLTGVGLIIVLAFGLYNWIAILIAIGIGIVLMYPVAYVISRWIKREDPAWDHQKTDDANALIPDPNAPEV
ncbi:hypothetical protein [Pontibaca salina]|uniref:Uncharacterized protein n=1 Tax=Pontibaca salina TaxID=2795731 RepID=A0A934HJR8_9RHOB|nr:hypothetical protein [Pontibaca salina]MBI6629418.1 hypothetical protein [Pontibaca salina]